MNPAPWTVPREAKLADAARLMQSQQTDLVLVVDDEQREVIGLVTDGDLRRVGVPPTLVEPQVCLACKATDLVCRHPRNSGLTICLDCLEKSLSRDNELGVGD